MMKKPKIFVQRCGSYSDEVLVICGASKRETLAFFKRNKVLVPFSKWVMAKFDQWNSDVRLKSFGLFCYDDNINGRVILLRPGEDTWNFWEVLMHEAHHLTLHIATVKGFLDEAENQAYLFEFLFRNMRRKLMGIDQA